jgi:hypothetical protein
MRPKPLIAKLEDLGISLDDIQGLPRCLKLPKGIARELRCEGVIEKIKKDGNKGIIWGEGNEYVALVKAWKK